MVTEKVRVVMMKAQRMGAVVRGAKKKVKEVMTKKMTTTGRTQVTRMKTAAGEKTAAERSNLTMKGMQC